MSHLTQLVQNVSPSRLTCSANQQNILSEYIVTARLAEPSLQIC